MADLENRLGVLEDELKLVKGEIKQILVDLRSIVMKIETPIGEQLSMSQSAPSSSSYVQEQA